MLDVIQSIALVAATVLAFVAFLQGRRDRTDAGEERRLLRLVDAVIDLGVAAERRLEVTGTGAEYGAAQRRVHAALLLVRRDLPACRALVTAGAERVKAELLVNAIDELDRALAAAGA